MEKDFLFESIYIIKETEYKKEFEEIKERLSKFKIEKIEDLGIRKLAYQVKGNDKGHYILIEFYAQKEDITKLETYCRRNDNILKWIFVRKDKEDKAND